MSEKFTRRIRRLVAVAASAGALVGTWMVGVLPAEAAPAPIAPAPSANITADALPTVQIDGVVWSQAVVGNTVWAGGKFNNARPAGAAAGSNLTARSNLLAYDITTGNLITSIAPAMNGQVLGVAASPDGTRIYAVGDFTSVTQNGVATARRRLAAFNAQTGALITSFAPVGVDAQAKAVVATNSTVYVGGSYGSAGGTSRPNLAAFSASTGALQSWNPNADYIVTSLAASADGNWIIAGGAFQNIGGQPAYGLAKINATTGAMDTSWQGASNVRDAGKDAGITSLKVQNGYVYGTDYVYGAGGNHEGTFKLSVDTGATAWLTDCHGDNYSAFLNGGVVYTAGHSHYCGNMGGGFPQYSTWKFQHAQAWSDTVTGDILNDSHGYPNWHGVAQGPQMVNWLPDMSIGSATGQYQAGWNVSGNDNYVVYGGEFPTVNGTGQQGLVRFGKRPTVSPKQGPRFANGTVAPTLVPTSTGSVRVTWPAGYDRDSYSLNYTVKRGNTTVFTTAANSNWWTLPALGFVDTGLTPGATYSYSVVVADSDGNTVNGASTSVTMPTSFAASNAYTNSVRSNGARIYWPMNETSGTKITDRAASATSGAGIGVTDGTTDTGLGWGTAGAIGGDSAATLNGTDQGRLYANNQETAPDTFSSQVWINTTTTSGGWILGFSDLQTGDSGHRDRTVYLDNSGHVVFGVHAQDNSMRTLASAKSYNDGQWHQITATMSPAGMALYVDGVRVGRRSDTTQGEAYLGNWRMGGDVLDGWPNQPSSRNFAGSVDEVAIYPTALSQDAIIAQYQASGRTSVIPPAPGDSYGAAVYTDDPDLYWRLAETSGTKALDSGRSLNTGTYNGGYTLGQTGAIANNTAASFDGNNGFVASDGQFSNPTVYSEEAWFNTTTNRGGKIIGFGDNPSGSSNNYDRHVYMQDDGKVVFGVWTGQTNTITTPGSYNDGGWHHVVATQASDGMKLYVDGVLIGTNAQTQAQSYNGYWKIGGDNTWGSSSAYFAGTIDEAAVYSYELGADRVTAHFLAGGGHLNQPPTAAFTSTLDQRRANLDGSGSSDPDGSIASYAWDFGDGSNGSGATASHVYASSGTYTVKLTVTDNKGAATTVSHDISVTVPAGPGDNYGAAVYGDGPRLYWRLGESSGTTAADSSGAQSPGTYYNGVTLGQPGALPIGNTAAQFDGSDDFVSSNEAFTNPTTYSEEAWFKTTTGVGGKIMGFGNNQSGLSSGYDRHIFMQDDGHLVFGTWTGQANTIVTDASYNNGQWHQVVATQGSDGMKLYVDGVLAGSNPQTQAQDYTGYWKLGGDYTWNSSSPWFNGTIDEAAVYEKVLTPAQVAAHYTAAAPAPNKKPTAAFSVDKTNLSVSTDASGSSDPDGTIANYSWDFGDGWTTTGKTASHDYAAKGTYTIKLTVTDDDGATDTVSHDVTVKAANVLPTARFSTTIDHSDLSVDAGASTDSDGTIASYAWDFGDHTSGSGQTAPHSYAQPGDYTVTLTVTDNDGGTDTVAHTVTATAPLQPPVAAFMTSSDGLHLSVDGSGSSDPDGHVTGWAWDFGDSATGTGATTTHDYAASGTYNVKLTVTDNDGKTSSTTQQVKVTRNNTSPTASFAPTVTNLKVDVDASASNDPDGTIAGYAWNYGDGKTGTGQPASHTYSAAGTYTITLTVTDNDGATASTMKDVTVAPAPNQAPTARFTSGNTDLTASFDGSTSSDPDGTVASYSWTFGDNQTGSGATTSHTYAGAGTYTVILTVTDDKGATGTVSHTVAVTAPTVIANDTFQRTVTNGWGSADLGGAWTTSSTASNLNVANGAGTMKMALSTGPAAYLNGVSAGDVELTSAFGFDKAGTGGGTYAALVARRIGTSDYRVKVRVAGTTTYLYLVKTVNNTETVLATQTVTGLSYAVGDTLQVRFDAQGTGTTTLRGKVWKTGTTEPTGWQLTTTDNTASLQNPGAVGIWTYLSSSTTNAPVTLAVSAFQVRPLP